MQYSRDGKPACAIAGCGRNRGTWDSSANSRRTAQRWAQELRAKNPGTIYKVETNF